MLDELEELDEDELLDELLPILLDDEDELQPKELELDELVELDELESILDEEELELLSILDEEELLLELDEDELLLELDEDEL